MRVTRSAKFKRDYRTAKKQQKDLNLLSEVVRKLLSKERLSSKYRDHKLTGRLKKYRELHLKADWLLIYQIDKDELKLARLGSHSELYD